MCCCCLLCRRMCFCIFTVIWFIVGTFVGGFVVKGAIASWYYKDKETIKDMVLNGAFYRLDWLHVLYGFSLSLVVYLVFLAVWAACWWVCCCGCCRTAARQSPPLPHDQQQHQRKGGGLPSRAGETMPAGLRPIGRGKLRF
jgi:hypothetical protein